MSSWPLVASHHFFQINSSFFFLKQINKERERPCRRRRGLGEGGPCFCVADNHIKS
jgi:hypothetical protein